MIGNEANPTTYFQVVPQIAVGDIESRFMQVILEYDHARKLRN
jgi:hypothetical protein